jgi:hypothetical protein
MSAMRSRTATSISRWALMLRMMPARIPPAMATIGIANTRKGTKTSSSKMCMAAS